MLDNHCQLNSSSFNCVIIYPCADAFYYHNEGILLRETNKYTRSIAYNSRSGRLRVINLYQSAQLEFLNPPLIHQLDLSFWRVCRCCIFVFVRRSLFKMSSSAAFLNFRKSISFNLKWLTEHRHSLRSLNFEGWNGVVALTVVWERVQLTPRSRIDCLQCIYIQIQNLELYTEFVSFVGINTVSSVFSSFFGCLKSPFVPFPQMRKGNRKEQTERNFPIHSSEAYLHMYLTLRIIILTYKRGPANFTFCLSLLFLQIDRIIIIIKMMIIIKLEWSNKTLFVAQLIRIIS